MPREDSASPFARAEACVTCPTSFEPFGMIVLPSDFTASVVCAFTASPGLHFFESIGEVSAALNAVPFASPFCAAADADVELEAPACACVFPASTDACPLVWAPACALVCCCADATTAKIAPATIVIPALFMIVLPPQFLGLKLEPTTLLQKGA